MWIRNRAILRVAYSIREMIMRGIALAAGVVVFVLLGCNGCDDTGGTTADPTRQACQDRDGDGWESGLLCDGPVDCDDADADINPDAEESCDGVDNNCDGEVDEGCVECDEEGATRDCGKNEGRCRPGVQTCTDGAWSACAGAEGPFSETCNGEDDDCDGEVDESPELLCNDGIACNGLEVCNAGQCEAQPVDCSHLDGPCATGMCSEKDGGCKAVPLENGTACDDGLFCTETGVCSFGVCETIPRDCSSAGDQCNTGVCDEDAGACVPQPISDGTSCDDGEFCTVSDVCTAGVCGGAERDCSAVADQCNAGVCDETSDTCVPSPVADDTACDDSQYCTVDDSCQTGQCTGGTPRECTAQGGSCRTGVCDETTDSCTGDPVPDGTSCDNDQFCTVNDTCVAGTCTSGDPRDCSSADGICKVGACSEALNLCVSNPAPDGSTCDDGAFCTQNDTCTAGSCAGSPRNCDSVADACNSGRCDDSADACVPQPVSDGTGCPDALFCTVMEVCLAGSCDTQVRDCSAEADQCNDGLCDETTDACVPQPLSNVPCDDGAFCTENDECVAGSCIGVQTDCSAVTMGDTCFDGVCDDTQNMCIAVDNGSCDGCAMGAPIADAGLDQDVVPNTTVQLDGTGSSDPTNQTLTYSWRIDTQPSGSNAQISNPASPTPQFLADVSGTFSVCLVVTDPDGCSSEDCMTVTVAPLADLHIELVWFSDDSDFDVHYQAPDYSLTKWFSTGACWWGNTNPDWGGGATGDQGDGDPTNDPSLDVDNITGFGPENINQDNLFDGDPFTIGVHYYVNSDPNLQAVTPRTDARIRVFESGVMVYEDTAELGCREFWEVGEVQVTGAGTSISVVPKNTITTVSSGSCRCSSNSDCPAGETCESRRFNPRGGPPVTRDICVP